MKNGFSFISLILTIALCLMLSLTIFASDDIMGKTWEFNTDGNTEGFATVQGMTSLTVSNGCLVGVTTGLSSDARIRSPFSLQLPNEYCMIKYRLKTSRASSTNSCMYFNRTSDGTGIDGERTVSLNSVSNNFVEYTRDLSTHASYNSEIGVLWFDPAKYSQVITFEYDYIRIYKKGANTISYNKNTTDTVTGMPSNDLSVASGTGFMLSSAVPTRAGYDFLGWSTISNGDPIASNKIDVSGNRTLYAVWGKPSVLTFDKQDYSGTAPDPINAYVGRATTLPESTITYGARVFIGWNDGATVYAAGTSYTPTTENVTFSPVFGEANAFYKTEGKYNAVTEKYNVDLCYISNKLTNLATFGFAANTQKMTFDSITYVDGIESSYVNQIGVYKNENGIFADQWYPSSGNIDASEYTKIATLTYSMTRSAYKTLTTADYTAYNYDEVVDTMFNGFFYVFAPHVPSFDVEYEDVTIIEPTVDKSGAAVTFTYDSDDCTVTGEATSPLFTEYSFTVSALSGRIIDTVTYSVGGGEAISLNGVGGIYTIPGENVLGDLSISVSVKGSPIAITGLTPPSVNGVPDTMVTLPENMTLTNVTWTPSVSNVFTYNTVYTAKITVAATGNYVFISGATATVNEAPAQLNIIDSTHAEITVTFPKTAFLRYDINGNGVLNMIDATVFLQYLAGQNVTVNSDALDADGDGTVALPDVVRVLKVLVGWEF